MIYLGSHINAFLDAPHIPITQLSLMFTTLVFLCATQDIAVDGWALTLLSEKNKKFSSTAQTIGLNTGYFLSFTVFLAFQSKEFWYVINCLYHVSMKFLGLTEGLLNLGGYLRFW